MENWKCNTKLQVFIEELEQYEALIAEESRSFRKGWKRWAKNASLTAAERQKAALICRFSFPGDREIMVEVLLYIRSQMAVLASGCPDHRACYWAQLWRERAEQLYEKVKILPGEDGPASKADQAYVEIVRYEKEIKRAVVRRGFLAGGMSLVVLSVLVVMFIWLPWIKKNQDQNQGQARSQSQTSFQEQAQNETQYSAQPQDSIPSQRYSQDQNQTTVIEHFAFSLPQYWREAGSVPDSDYYQYYAETGGKVVVLAIACPMDEDPVTLDMLYANSDDRVKMLESWFVECQVTEYEDFQSEDGVKGILYSYQAVIRVEDDTYGVSGKAFFFPSIEDNRWFLVIMNRTENTSSTYEEDFMELLASIRQTVH